MFLSTFEFVRLLAHKLAWKYKPHELKGFNRLTESGSGNNFWRTQSLKMNNTPTKHLVTQEIQEQLTFPNRIQHIGIHDMEIPMYPW